MAKGEAELCSDSKTSQRNLGVNQQVPKICIGPLKKEQAIDLTSQKKTDVGTEILMRVTAERSKHNFIAK